MEERREIHRWRELADLVDWTCEDEHGHEVFRRGDGETPEEMAAAGYVDIRPEAFADEIWIAEEHAGCGGRQVYAVKA